MKPWIPVVIAVPLAAGVAVWALLTDPGQTAPITDGADPGEVACTTLITDDLLTLLHDGEAEYAQWGNDVYELAQDAAESADMGIATAAEEIIDYYAGKTSFAPIELHAMTEDLAYACVAAGHITQAQVDKAS